MNESNSIVQFYRGPKSAIDKINTIEDGKLYFSTDTKQIMMDCNFVDSSNNNYNKRIVFGGSTGIIYGKRGAFQEDEDFSFKLDELENTEELPQVDDLILNDDGCFYRVTQVFPLANEVATTRLTLQGSGGGGTGGGGSFFKTYITNSNSYFSINDEKIPLSFSCYYEDGTEALQMEITVNDQPMGSIGVLVKDQIKTLDLTAYRNLLRSNSSNTIRIKFTAQDSERSTYMTFNVFLHDIYIEIDEDSLNLNAQHSDCPFTVYPYGGVGDIFDNRAIVYELRELNSESVIWSHKEKTQADVGEKITYYIPHQLHGTYSLTVYLEVSIKNSDQILTSEKHITQIPFYDAGQSAPLITLKDHPSPDQVQYNSIRVGYMVYYTATSTSDINLIIEIDKGNGRELLQNIFTTVINSEWQPWDITFSEVGTYYLTVELKGTEYSQSFAPISVAKYTVEDGESAVPIINTSDSALQLYLSARGRLNNETNKDIWESKYGSSHIKCDLQDFNWLTNGWLQDQNGDTALHLTNGAKVIVPFSPFQRDTQAKGAERLGRVIELDFRISNIRDLTQAGITCKSVYTIETDSGFVEKINTGIQVYGNKAQLFSVLNTPQYEDMSGRTTIFREGDRIHLAYIINSLTDSPARIVYTMLNGIVSSLSLYDAKDQFVDESSKNPSEFIFDSTFMDIDIYNIRVYGTSKTPNFILQNHFADNQSIDEAVEEWRVNNVISSIKAKYDTTKPNDTKAYVGIDLDKVRKTISVPYMIFEDGRQTSDKKDKGWENDKADVVYPISSESRLPTGKKDFRHMTIEYVDPQHPENNIPKGTIVTCYAQGTSSLEYPVKNLRIYFKEDPYALFSDVPPVHLFTLKADYMESSSSHNTGTANALNELYDSIGLQSPAASAYPSTQNMLTAIMGKPIVCFYRPYENGYSNAYPYYYQYIGRYNFNYDKATHEIFGFESLTAEESANGQPYGYLLDEEGELRAGFNTALEVDEDSDKTYYRIPSLEADETEKVTIAKEDEDAFETAAKLGPLYEYKEAGSGVTTVQCWEFLNNTAPLVGFRTAWNEDVDKVKVTGTDEMGKEIVLHEPYQDWTGAFESRFPEHTTEASTDKRALARMVNWVASTNRHPDVIAKELAERGVEVNEDTIATEANHRLRRFKDSFNDYFVKEFVTFYYILTEFLVMMDSRGKNMMMACYDADPDKEIGHWMPIFYDMDTMLGLNNSGQLVYSYDVEDDEANLFNLAATYKSTQYSVLWCNFKDAFGDDIKTMYHNLRKQKVFNLGTFLKLYNERQGDAWDEIYLNEDADYKYIDPLVSGYEVYFDPEGNIITKAEADKTPGSTKKTAQDYLYAAQGSRSQHRAYWLQRRFDYLDSKYDYNAIAIGTSASVLNVRLSSEIQKSSLPFNAVYSFTPKYNQYVTLSYQNADESSSAGKVGPTRLYENETKDVAMPLESAKDQEAYFWGIENMKDIGLQADKYYQKFIINKPLNVTSLDIGTFIKGWENDGLGEKDKFTISSDETVLLPFLEKLNVQNCTKLKDVLSLANCPYLQEVYAYGTNYPTIKFFEGGNLKHVELPATTSSLTLKGQLYFDTFSKRSDEEVDNFKTEYMNKLAKSLTQSLAKKNMSEEEIQKFINNIELTPIQREHLTLEGYDNLTSLRISNCPLVDSKNFIKKLLKEGTDENGQLIYRTNLRNFRMEDINWVITKDECILTENDENGTIKVQIKTIPILDILTSLNGINNADNTIDRQEAGNDYFAGTITIDNKDLSFGISEYILYNKYEKLFPGLKFKYTNEITDKDGNIIDTNPHNTKAYYIGINNALNQPEAKYSKKIAATEIEKISNDLLDWFTPVPLENGTSFDPTHIPPLTKTKSAKYNYQFVGWGFNKSESYNEDGFDSYESQLAAAQEACKIIIEKQEDGSYKATSNNFNLTESSFDENQEINFYPIYLGIINFYTVKFFWKKDGKDILLKEEQVKYNYGATPPLPPQNIELTDDVEVTNIWPFTGYNIPYNKVTTDISTYAQFGSKQSMKDLTGDEIETSYFEEDTWSGSGDIYFDSMNICKLKVKASFTGEALIVPRYWEKNGVKLPVAQIGLYQETGEYCTTLKRMYFESGSEIQVLRGPFLDASADGPLCQNFEYLEFSKLTQLKYIPLMAFYQSKACEINMLPNSVEQIHNNAFDSMTKCYITVLPKNLQYIGENSFANCSGLKDLNFNTATALKTIGAGAFSNCVNLTATNETILPIQTIGKGAFQNCSSLVLNFATNQSSNIQIVEDEGFYNSAKSLNNLPNQLTEIGFHSFAVDGNSEGSTIPMNFDVLPSTLTKIASGAFFYRKTSKEIWYLQVPSPSQIQINYTAFYSIDGLKTIIVPWDLQKAYEIDPYIGTGWSGGAIKVMDVNGNTINADGQIIKG